jgi:hypothetical protein
MLQVLTLIMIQVRFIDTVGGYNTDYVWGII